MTQTLPPLTGQTTDFELSESLAAFRDKSREFAQREFAPHAAEWDYGRILRIAKDASSPESAERQEFIQLLERARGIVSRVAAR